MSRRITAAFIVAAASVLAIALAAASTLPEDIHGYLGWNRANVNKNFIESPHPEAKDVYYNDIAAETIDTAEAVADMEFPFAEGSIFVKETLDPDSLQVPVITTMRKVDGFDPDNNDWQYGMFERQEDGTFAGEWFDADAEMAAMCVECHTAVADQDFTFLDYLGQ